MTLAPTVYKQLGAYTNTEYGFPVVMAFCHRYPDYINGLFSITISKSLGPNVEREAMDGVTYSGDRVGICSLSFVNDVSDHVLLGDLIYVIRASPTGAQKDESGLGSVITDYVNNQMDSLKTNWKRRNLKDTRGTVIFQGVCIGQGWSQHTEHGTFTQHYKIVVADLTHFMNDNNMFGRKFVESGVNPSLHFDEILRHDYKIDVRQTYRREDLVDKLVKNYLHYRIGGGTNWGNALIKFPSYFAKLVGQSATTFLGLKYDGAIDAFDFVRASEVFKGRNPSISPWDYINRLTSPPLYESFVREDTGLIVFRRAAWDRIGSSVEKFLNMITYGAANNSSTVSSISNQLFLSRGQSWLWPIPASYILFTNINKNTQGLADIVMLARDGDRLRNSRLGNEYLQRLGIHFQASRIPLYDPELTFRCSNIGSALSDGAKGLAQLGLQSWTDFGEAARRNLGSAYKELLGKKFYSPLNVQNNILRMNVADIFKGSITLRSWLPICVGDHIKIAKSDSGILNPVKEQLYKWQTGFIGKSARTDDFTFYVTSKQYHAEVSEGEMVETMKLELHYGGLEFVDPASLLSLKIIHK